jgi:hypothetical protein
LYYLTQPSYDLKDVWTKAEEHVVKIEKEYCKENCIDRSVIEHLYTSCPCKLAILSVL